jgi:hypothetical protein
MILYTFSFSALYVVKMFILAFAEHFIVIKVNVCTKHMALCISCYLHSSAICAIFNRSLVKCKHGVVLVLLHVLCKGKVLFLL